VRPLKPQLTLVFASSNRGKIAELRDMLPSAISLQSALDFPETPEVVEDEPTFEGNAAKKAQTFALASNQVCLADDSGLCVDALHGSPGVHSARYAPTNDERIDKLLHALADVPSEKRGAHFVCVFCLVVPGSAPVFARGECHGTIARERQGTGGFGYDPIFLLTDGRSLAQLTVSEKAKVSHRGQAFRNLAMYF
jgi:XTP/dITP diphosphohydrolase